MKTRSLLAAACTTAVAVGSQAAVIDGISGPVLIRSSTLTTTLDASGSDMLVVILGGEHGFNNTSGQVSDVTYGGVSLTRIVDRNPITSGSDISYADIWIMENPGANHTDGVISASVSNRGGIMAYAISDVTGVVQSGFGTTGQVSQSLNVTAGNLVIAGLVTGGDGNTGNITNVTADAPLNLDGKEDDPSNWNGLAGASDIVDTTGSTAYGFSGAQGNASVLVWAEFENVPEPSSLALLGLGGLLIARRRRG